MKTTQLISLLTLLTVSSSLADPEPAVRFELAPSRPNYLPYAGLNSSRGGDRDFQTLTRFMFESDENIHEFHWRGSYDMGDSPLLPSELSNLGNWEITVWSDDSGEPGEVIATETVPASEVTQIETDTEHYWNGPREFYDFSFKFATPFEAQARTQYWISAVYLGESEFPVFLFDSGATGQVPVEQMAWAAIRQPLGNSLFLARHENPDNPPILSDSLLELEATQATMKLLTLPKNDADNDGMDDDWESKYSFRTNFDDSADDRDRDGLSNLDEFIRGTDPRNLDTDNDGLPDGVESNSGVYLDNTDTGTSPLLGDSDRDGLGDAIEVPTQPFVGAGQPGTDPNQKDTDKDGYADQLEIEQGLSPIDDTIHPTPLVLTALVGNDLTEAEGASFDHEESARARPSDREGTFMNLFDNMVTGPDSFWKTRAIFKVGVTLDTRHVIESFTLTSVPLSSRDGDPRAWELQGSTDGVHFETIFHRDNPAESVWTAPSQTVRFEAGIHYPQPPAFTTFRLHLYGYQDAPEETVVSLGELELFGSEAVKTVNNTDNSGTGSLRQAINDCPENGIITFDSSLSGETINLVSPLTINKNMKVDASSLAGGTTLKFSFSSQGTGITVDEQANVELTALKIRGSGRERGILNHGQLTINRSSISGFSAGFESAIVNEGSLKMVNTTLFDNRGHLAGALLNGGTATLDHCTISGNTLEYHYFLAEGGDYGSGSGIMSRGELLLNYVTIAGNRGHGIRLDSGGLYLEAGSAQISNSIIAGNNSEGNHDLLIDETASSVTLSGTNLFSSLARSGLTEGPSIIVADPRLAPLGDYGGPTPTMLLMPGSPAIDVHDNPITETTDQRGFPRLVASDYDLGAVEYQGDADFAHLFHVDNDGDGNSFGIEQALGTDPYTRDQNHPNNLGAPTFNGDARPVLTFGLNSAAHPETTWILERSSDLLTFEEIYAFDGTTDFATEGIPIEADRSSTKITITDEAPPANGAYYRFRAMLR